MMKRFFRGRFGFVFGFLVFGGVDHAVAQPPLVGFAPNAGSQQVVQPDIRATGQTLNAAGLNAAVTVPLANAEGTIGFTVTGLTASGATLTAEASNDGGTTWTPVNAVAPASGALSTTIAADSQFRLNGAGHTTVRLRVSVVGAGTVTVFWSASSVAALPALSAPLPAGANAIGSVQSGPLPYIPQPLTNSVIVTTGTPVVALAPGTHNKGGWLRNCNASGVMFINDQAPASLVESGSNAALAPGLGGTALPYWVPAGQGTIYAAGQAGAKICGEGQN